MLEPSLYLLSLYLVLSIPYYLNILYHPMIGDTVGYSIRLENRSSARTRLLYCTTGILLRRLMSSLKIESVSHVIIDEVHERSVDIDFLLVILKFLCEKRADLKLVRCT